MPIDQTVLNSATRDALRDFCGSHPTNAGPLTETPVNDSIEFSIANPWLSDRPLEVWTEGAELTVGFVRSHYHITGDDEHGRTEANLVEEMIRDVASIVSGDTRAYSAYAGTGRWICRWHVRSQTEAQSAVRGASDGDLQLEWHRRQGD